MKSLSNLAHVITMEGGGFILLFLPSYSHVSQVEMARIELL